MGDLPLAGVGSPAQVRLAQQAREPITRRSDEPVSMPSIFTAGGPRTAQARRDPVPGVDPPAERGPGLRKPRQVDGAVAAAVRPPPAFFTFASPTDEVPGRANGIPVSEIRGAISRYGTNVMIGFDRGAISDADLRAMRERRPGDIQNPALRFAVQQRVRLHVYVEGPGGATGGRWSDDEKKRVRAAADSVGIRIGDPSDPRDPGARAWRDHGWRQFTRHQLTELRRAGFESAEIDNIDASTVGKDPRRTLAFLGDYARWHRDGEVPTLMLKNMSDAQTNAPLTAIASGQLPRAMLSDFAIAERDAGQDRDALARSLATAGIRLLHSNDTRNYDASGAY